MKRKRNQPLDAARQDAIAAARDLVQVAAEKVGPSVHTAADRIAPLVDKTTQAAHQAASRVSPYAQSAVDRVSPYAQTAVDKVSPYAQSAVEYIVPAATAAGQRSAQVASEAVERLGPAVEEALSKVGPAVDAARVRVTVDLLPKLTEALSAAAASPVVLEATRRGKATVAAARGELALPEEKKTRPWLRRVAVVAVLGGVGAVAARKFLGSQDSGWQSARPTAPYAPPAAPPRSEEPTVDQGLTPPPGDPLGAASAATGVAAAQPAATDAAVADSELEGTPVEETQLGETFGDLGSPEVTALEDRPAEDRPMEETVTDPGVVDLDADPEVAAGVGLHEPGAEASSPEAEPEQGGVTGEGGYVGDQPPEGYTIKGNSRSRKYHLPDSPAWTQTTAEVWFNSEDAAQAAGFTRAHG